MDQELNPQIFSAIRDEIDKHPKATGLNVYLGDNEWKSLVALMEQFGAGWAGGTVTYDPRAGQRAEFMECPIYRVDASNHLSVGESK